MHHLFFSKGSPQGNPSLSRPPSNLLVSPEARPCTFRPFSPPRHHPPPGSRSLKLRPVSVHSCLPAVTGHSSPLGPRPGPGGQLLSCAPGASTSRRPQQARGWDRGRNGSWHAPQPLPCPACPPTQESCHEVMVTDFRRFGWAVLLFGTPGSALRASPFCTGW